MKRILLLLLLSTISSLTFAQKALFDKYEDVNGVTTVYISKAMLRMMRNLPTGNRDISAYPASSTVCKFSIVNDLR